MREKIDAARRRHTDEVARWSILLAHQDRGALLEMLDECLAALERIDQACSSANVAYAGDDPDSIAERVRWLVGLLQEGQQRNLLENHGYTMTPPPGDGGTDV